MARILIATDTRIYAEGIGQLLGRANAWMIVDLVTDAASAYAVVANGNVDILLIDIGMQNSADVIARVAEQGLQVVALGIDNFHPGIMQYVELGASGFVSRDASAGQLKHTINEVLRGELSCSPRFTRALMNAVRSLARGVESPVDPLSCLTLKERSIAEYISQGLSNQEIANILHIGVATVKNHVHRVLTKLGVQRRGQVAALIRDRGISDQVGDKSA